MVQYYGFRVTIQKVSFVWQRHFSCQNCSWRATKQQMQRNLYSSSCKFDQVRKKSTQFFTDFLEYCYSPRTDVMLLAEMWWSGTMRADICGSSMITPTKEREKDHTLLQDGRPWSYLSWEISTKLPLYNIRCGEKEGHIQGTFHTKADVPIYRIRCGDCRAGYRLLDLEKSAAYQYPSTDKELRTPSANRKMFQFFYSRRRCERKPNSNGQVYS